MEAVVNAARNNWELAVVFDWTGGFWKKMVQENLQIIVV
jgi:hypothetical protein